jgi:hypothetical protein
MYLPNIEPLTSLGCPLNAVFHILRGSAPQYAETPTLLLLQMFNLPIISIAVLDQERFPDAGLQKRATISPLIVGPARPTAGQAAAQAAPLSTTT